MAFRGPKTWLWRWRRNPLRRRADMVEAWVVLGAWVVTVLAGVLAGWTAARGVERVMARERMEWRPTAAVVTERAPGLRPGDRDATGDGTGRGIAHGTDALRVWAEVRWSAPDGSSHTGQARVEPGSAVGSRVTVWTDPGGRLVARPATPAQAQTRALPIGGLAGI
ncbi:Rv1733c family protein, partial [Streptomyces carpinensis]|uniref:Rv1733c family protein n=1 Tax=Streptomyces carpinensis TaxID=66369 RepID=UPI001180C902